MKNFHRIFYLLHKYNDYPMKLIYIPGDNFRKKDTFFWNSPVKVINCSKKIVCPVKTNCGKFLKRWEYQTTLPASWEICVCEEGTVRTGHGTTDWFQIGKAVCQVCILSPCLFNLYAEYIMRNAGWMKHKLKSRLLGEISITSDMQRSPPLWQKVKKN